MVLKLFEDFLSPKLTQQIDLSKKSQTTNTTNTSIQTTSSFSDARSLSIVLNSPNSSIANKTALDTKQTPEFTAIPTVSPNFTASPQTAGSTNTDTGSASSNISSLLITGGLIAGGLIVLSGIFSKKKK